MLSFCVNRQFNSRQPRKSRAICLFRTPLLSVTPLQLSIEDPDRVGTVNFQLLRRTSIPVRCLDLSPLFATLTKTAGCVPKIPKTERSGYCRNGTFPLTPKRNSHDSRILQ